MSTSPQELEQRARLLRPMLAAATRGAETLPPAERADVFDGVSAVAGDFDNHLASEAHALADAFREAEAMQTRFRNLFDEDVA